MGIVEMRHFLIPLPLYRKKDIFAKENNKSLTG